MPSIAPERPPLHVVAGVVRDNQGRVLVAERLRHQAHGGLWEFPGGKREPGESPLHALRRELSEELDLEVGQAHPLIQVLHRYPARTILLDVWEVAQWRGEPWGREGQVVEWCEPRRLAEKTFPEANYPILRALQLPEFYLITPPPDAADFLPRLEACLRDGVRLVQLRAPDLDPVAYRELAAAALDLCLAHQARLLLNADPALVPRLGAHGVHLNGPRLHRLSRRPLPADSLVAASCHHAADLAQAQRLGVDFVVLSPVRPTASHPHAPALGWQRFQQLCQTATCPVYALGGLLPRHLDLARAHGAQGIAAVRGLWDGC